MEESPTSTSSDFISFGAIRKTIIDFFQLSFKSLGYLSFALKRNILLLLMCLLLGAVFSYLFYFFKPKYYTSNMIVYNNNLSIKDYSDIIGNLNSLLFTQSYNDFSEKLKIEKRYSVEVLNIKVLSRSNEIFEKATSGKVGVPFKIQINLRNVIPLNNFQNALLFYLNNNAYVKQINNGQKEINLQRLNFIYNEQSKLDSLKLLYNGMLRSMRMPTTIYNNAINPADIYIHSDHLSKERDSILKWINDKSDAIMLIDGFKFPRYSQTIPAVVFILMGLATGMFIGVILSILITIKNKFITDF